MSRTINKFETVLQVGRTFGVRDGLLRLQYEVQRGSGLMSRRMRAVEGWDAWKLDRISRGVRAEELLPSLRDGQRRFFFSDARSAGAAIKKIIGPEGEAKVVAEAEKILKGHLPFFGALSFDCGFPPRWFQNPATGERVSPDLEWTGMRFASPIYGDLKFILEPSRFLFAYPLVRAYAITGDDRFAEAFWLAVEDWAHHNPPMSGPLWICGQECTLRILAWSFALFCFLQSAATSPKRAALLLSIIAAHAWRTEQTLGYARSQRSNHLISEAVGLWTAGTLYPELMQAQAWQSLGAELLREAVVDQITPQGVSQQHSFNYQRMILHLLLWTVRLAEIQNVPLPREIRQRARAGCEFIATWIDPASGCAPNYGANDGSLILPLACASYSDFRPLLQLGAAVLKLEPLHPGTWDEPAAWLGAESAGRKGAFISHQPRNIGYFRLGDDDSWAMIRAGCYTHRPFQADQLHMDIWGKGVNLARDAGTYLYNAQAPWNNGLAGTAVHNTVAVDRADQMRRAGRFLWVDWAQATGRVYSSAGSDRPDCFQGEHDGYKRFGVTHRRTVRWLPGCGWIIVDDLLGSGTHDARLHWLLADLPIQISVPAAQVGFKLAESLIRWKIFCCAEGNLAIVRAGKQMQIDTAETNARRKELSDDELQILGWQSPTYGDLQPAVSLVYHTRGELPLRMVSVLLTNEDCKIESSGDEILISRIASGGVSRHEIYRVSPGAKPREFDKGAPVKA